MLPSRTMRPRLVASWPSGVVTRAPPSTGHSFRLGPLSRARSDETTQVREKGAQPEVLPESLAAHDPDPDTATPLRRPRASRRSSCNLALLASMKADLQRIARHAMVERGLLPDFSAAASCRRRFSARPSTAFTLAGAGPVASSQAAR